jgi:hypothetical protein
MVTASKDPGQLAWSLIDPHWDVLCKSWDRGAEAFVAEMQKVPLKVQHLFPAHWCESEVCNGGFHQFFYNSTGILAPEAAQGYAAIGANELSTIVSEAMLYFGPTYPRERADRLALLPNPLGRKRELWDPFSSLDSRFYDWLESERNRWERLADAYAADA